MLEWRQRALAVALAGLLLASTVAGVGAVGATQPEEQTELEAVAGPSGVDTTELSNDGETTELSNDSEASDGSTRADRRRPDGRDRPGSLVEQSDSLPTEDERTPSAGSSGVEIAPELANATGSTQLIVRFEDPDRRTLRRSDDVVRTLRDRSAASERALREFARVTPGVEIQRSFWITNAALVTVDADRTEPRELAAVDGVTEVHPNYAGTYESVAATGPVQNGTESHDDPDFSNVTSAGYTVTYGLEMVGAPEFWTRYDTRGANATVAVIDSGIDAGHPDLNLTENGWAEFDAAGNRINSSPHDPIYSTHGTHVSGTVAGGNASGSHIGVAPEANLMVAGSGYNLSVASAYASIEWAIEHENDVDVITASLGFGEGVDALQDPIRNARLSGIVFVGSAGNSENGTVTTPGDSFDGINVGAVDRNGDVAEFSSSATIDADAYWNDVPADWPEQYTVPTVTAPGVDVCSSVGGGGYDCSYDGTSMAAPHVAGAAALLRSANPNMSVEEIRLRLSRTAETPANLTDVSQVRYGHGIVNVTRAQAGAFADVNGTVRTNGTPAAGIWVETEAGMVTTTAGDGGYELTLPAGNRTLTVDTFGYAPVNRTLNLSAGDRVTEDVNLTVREPEVERRDAFANRSDPGETVNATVSVAGASNLTVTPTSGFTDPANTSLTVAGDSTVDYGDPVSIDPDGQNVTIELRTNESYVGAVEVDVVATWKNRSTTTRSRQTMVFGEFVRYPSDVPAGFDLGTVATGVGANATVVVENGTHAVTTEDANLGNAPLVLRENTTVRAATNATPIVQFNATADAWTGILLYGNRSMVSGLTVRGDGTRFLVGANGVNVTARDLRLHNGSYGVLADGIADEVTGNVVTNVSTGIYTYWSVSENVTDNRIVNATDVGIYASGAFGTIANNTITSGVPGSDGLDLWAYGDSAKLVADNTVRVSQNGSTGAVVSAYEDRIVLANNSIDGDTGITVTGGSAATLRNNVVGNATVGVSISDYRAEDDSPRQVIANTTVGNASDRGIRVEDIANVSLADNEVAGAGLALASVRNVSVHNTTIEDAPTGVTIEGERGSSSYYDDDERSQNVSVSGTNASAVAAPAVAIHGGADEVSVGHPNATIVLDGAGWDATMAVRNVTFADGTTVSANGTNATLAPATVPNGSPPNRSRVGNAVVLERNGTNASADVAVDLGGGLLDPFYDGTVALFRHDGGNWSRAGTNHVAGNRVVASNVTTFGTLLAFGEASGTLQGSVVDADGSPVENATVTLQRNGTRIGTLSTNATGEYAGDAPISATHAVASHRAFRNSSVGIDVPENGTERLNFTIERKPIYVTVSNLSLSEDVHEDDSYQASATVSNRGANDSTTTVQYLVDGSVVANESVSLAAGGATTVTFEHVIEDYGYADHTIRTVNQSVSDTFYVDFVYGEPDDGDDGGGGGGGGGFYFPPPDDGESGPSFVFRQLDVPQDTVTVGESFDVEFELKNEGDATGEYTYTVTADGEALHTETVELDPGWYTASALEVTLDEPGTYRIEVDGQYVDTVTVTGEPDIELSQVRLNRDVIEPGQSISARGVVSNEGSAVGERAISLVIDGEIVDTTQLELSPGERQSVWLAYAFDEPGLYSVTYGGENLGQVRVENVSSDGAGGQANDSENGGGGGGMPGFGPILALLGIVGGLLLAGRANSYR